MPIAPTAVHVGGMAAGGGAGASASAGAMEGAEGGAASAVASLTAANHSNAAAGDVSAKPTKPAAKKPAAKKQKTAGKAAAAAATTTPTSTPGDKRGKAGGTSDNGKSDDGKSNYDSMDDDDLSDGDLDGEDKGGRSADEVRRQRRMLSNRESARRSRRRKLEHVSTLEGQIAVHKAETAAVLERLQLTEQRMESVLRENGGLKAEMERLRAQLQEAAAGGKGMERSLSLQRIASTGNLVKSSLGGGDASPQIGGDDSPRGFVPFRSLQSYENLLSLQAQTR